MPNAVVMTGYGPPEVLKWAQVPLPEPGPGQIRIKVRAAGISPTDLALRAGYLKDAIPLPPHAVLGFEAAGTVDAAGPGVSGMSTGDAVTALLFGLGGYAEPAPGRAPGALDETIVLLADGRLRLRAHQSMPMQQAPQAHHQLERGTVHKRIILTPE
jgi:NADPH:quinone reductase-like Zn-dependent oxidoreductase